MLRPNKLKLSIQASIFSKMNDPITWDPSLVKKFRTSSHYKLLIQLRNEVKKYPLNNRKKTLSTQNKLNNPDNKNKQIDLKSQISSVPKGPNLSNENNNHKSTVSFNNAKNFSIYNQSSSNNISQQNEKLFPDQTNSNDDTSSHTFKERLNQIDMK